MSLRCYLNLMTLEDLPDWSAGPKTREPEPLLAAIRDSGYDGVQFIAPLRREERDACDRLNLGRAGLGRVNRPEESDALAARLADEGMECGTLHLGWGLEDDDDAAELIESVLEASERHRIPLFVETHRATLFQDIWRTVQFVRRFPELQFNGDFSHWYTGLEMVYGGFEMKLAFIEPVLERVRFLHGRIGDPGCIQVDLGEGPVDHPYVAHFRTLWSEVFRRFRALASTSDHILFVPELLSPRIYYGRTHGGKETSDRWQQCIFLRNIASDCYAAAAPPAAGHRVEIIR
jgi:sugar phosphate isomerase/epimerase